MRDTIQEMPALTNNSGLRDNHTRGSVADFLREQVRSGSKLSIVSAYFTIYAFDALKAELEGIEHLDFLFGEPSFINRLDPDKTEKKAFLIDDDGLKLSNRLQQKRIASECAEWIKSKVEIKTVKQSNLLHGKMYHIDNGGVEEAILGSSNFTVRGLGLGAAGNNIELNLIVDSRRDRQELKQWFSEVWNDARLVQDVKAEVLDYLAKLHANQSPQFLYYLTLFHLFREELEGIRDLDDTLQRTTLLESQVWKALFSFQKDGVKGAINKIIRFNGCILADSVGLGKTFEALAVIKYFNLRNESVLVLCPKKLRQNWEIYRPQHTLCPLPQDKLDFQLLSHTDLSRTSGQADGYDLTHFNWQNYGLIVIDESHNFRNNAVGKEKEDGERRRSRYERLIEDVIQSGVKTKVLLLSATPVNNGIADLRNQISLIAGGDVARDADPAYDAAFQESLGVPSVKETTRQAQNKFTLWTKKPPAQRHARDLIHELGSDFFKLLDGLSIARSRSQIKRYYAKELATLGGFPDRDKPRAEYPAIDATGHFLTFQQLDEKIGGLTLSLYHPSSFLKDDLPAAVREAYAVKIGNFNQEGRERILIAMMKVNFLKRLESSIDSFRLTLERTIKKIDDLKTKIDDFQHAEQSNPTYDFANLSDEDFDDLDLDPADLKIGGKHKINLGHLKLPEWKLAVDQDRSQLQYLLDHARPVGPQRDAKLLRVRKIIEEKITSPSTNRSGEAVRKVIVFTAFADTARYLWKHLAQPLSSRGGPPLQSQGSGPLPSAFIPYSHQTPTQIAHQNLPHWSQPGCTYFITYRLADSIPQEKLDQWRLELETWLALHPEPWSKPTQAEYDKMFARKEAWLDAGHGECLLRADAIRTIVETNLRHFDQERYILDEFVIMPNHVHLLVKPLGGHALADILHSWKSFTSKAINKALGRKGTLWQEESYDHIVRDWEELEHYRRYISDNPKGMPLESSRGGSPLKVAGAASPVPVHPLGQAAPATTGQAAPATYHAALITGGGDCQTTLGKSEFDHILTNFSPRSKGRERQPSLPQNAEIDLLIATDCISEGQNLQDCDLLINYDIHWNPVRIIQRFGRIDRIGSKNARVSLVNFWPTQDLDAYLNVKHRVEARMALVDLTATGEDNLLNTEQFEDLIETDLHYRNQQLKRLQNEILDLEDLNEESISLADFSLADFRMDLLRFLEANREALESSPLGLYAVVPPDPQLPASAPGILFCLRQRGEERPLQVNPLAPHYLVYVRDDGSVRLTFAQPKQSLELLRALAAGQPAAFEQLCDLFDASTQNGTDMAHENTLLDRAIESIKATFARRSSASLLSGRGGLLPTASETPSAPDDLELVT